MKYEWLDGYLLSFLSLIHIWHPAGTICGSPGLERILLRRRKSCHKTGLKILPAYHALLSWPWLSASGRTTGRTCHGSFSFLGSPSDLRPRSGFA